MSSRVVVACALAVTVGACRGPVYMLVPTPGAGGPPLPVSVRVLRVAVTKELEQTAASLEPDSEIAVELQVINADPKWPASIGQLSLLVRDALGGPDVWAAPIDHDEIGVIPYLPRPERVPTGPFTVPPGETMTVWRVFGGFPPDGPSTPLRATVFVPVQGQPPLAIAIIDPVPGGPRWRAPTRSAVYLTLGNGNLGSGTSEVFYDPVGLSARRSSGGFTWGFDWRLSIRRRDVPGGTLTDGGASLLGDFQWLPWHGPGLYLEGGAFIGAEGLQNLGYTGTVFLPRVSGGVTLGVGRLPGQALFPVERPRSPQRRLALRIGYVEWFNTGEGWGSRGLQISLETMIGP